jgi:hypothetical protein
MLMMNVRSQTKPMLLLAQIRLVEHLELLPAPVVQTPTLVSMSYWLSFHASRDGHPIVALSHGTARPSLMKSNSNILTGLSPSVDPLKGSRMVLNHARNAHKLRHLSHVQNDPWGYPLALVCSLL